MAGFVKLFGSIVTSSVWCQDDKVLRVWIAMLALCDAQGVVEGSIPGFASICRMTPDELRTALAVLTGPDPDSRTSDHEGRRLEAVPGGWRVLNYAAYRDRGQAKEGSRAPYLRAYRASHKQSTSLDTEGSIAIQTGVSRNTEERREKKEVPPKPPKGGGRRRSRSEILSPFSEGTRRVVNTLGAEWHKEDPRDGRRIVISPEGFAEAVDRIKAEQPHVDDEILIEAGRNYLAEKRERYKAPQWFLGVEGPWGGYVRAILTRRERVAGRIQSPQVVDP